MKAIKILHLIQRVSRGGAARSMMATAKYSSRLGYFEHQVISLTDAEPAACEIVKQSGMSLLQSREKETRYREIEAADIVHVHFWNNPEIYELLRSDLPALRLLIWFHVCGDQPPQVITRELIDFSDFALTSSPYTNELPVFHGLSDDAKVKKTGMVYDATDLARLSRIEQRPHRGFNIGYIGTVDFTKMHPNYVAMSSQICIPGVRFLVYGSGNGFVTLKQQTEKLGVAERFDFGGYIEDLKSVLEILDVFGYPLCKENYSTAELVLQESMYAGVPPVIFPYGGAQRTIVHNRTGLIVNSELEYKEAIEYLYENPEERARLGGNARKYARECLGAENSAKQLNLIYEQLMGLPKKRRKWGIRFIPCQDLTGNAPTTLGSELFIQSLGDSAPYFSMSMKSQDLQELFEADRKIAASSPVLCNAGGGGIFHYRSYYPGDGYLRFWSGLVLQEQGRFALAVSEFVSALRLGCDHWRVSWHLAQAAKKIDAHALVEDALDVVLRKAPEFAEAHRIDPQARR